MRKLIHFYWLHLKVGYIAGAILVPFFFLLLVGVDVIRMVRLGPAPHLVFAYNYNARWIIKGAALSAVLIAVMPVIFAPWKVSSRGTVSITRFLRHQSKACSLTYIVMCIILIYCVIFCHNLELLAGNAFVEKALRPAFSSFFLIVIWRLPPYLWPLLSVLFAFMGASKILVDWPGTRRIDFRAYHSRLELSAPSGQFAPWHGLNQSNFNLGRLAPVLKCVRKEWISILGEYQESVPGSHKATEYLENTWAEVKKLLGDFGIREEAGMQIRLVTSTSRALQIALNEVSPEACVLLSPFEHPTESIVARVGHEIQPMLVDSGFFYKSWDKQKAAVVKWVQTQLTNKSASVEDESMVLIISEVCWATGRHILVHQLINEIKSGMEANQKLAVIIDGAHAVGNLDGERPVALGDAYVFSGHKWLLAPEPCGLVLTNSAISMYDVWVDKLPDTTVGAAHACGLLASLRILSSLKQDLRTRRSCDLRKRLRTELEDAFEIIGKKSGLEETNLVSVRPSQDFEWGVDSELFKERLLQHNIHATVIKHPFNYEGETKDFWVRFSIGWFLGWKEIRDLTRFLHGSVTRAHGP